MIFLYMVKESMACKIDEAKIESVALENKCIRSWAAVAG